MKILVVSPFYYPAVNYGGPITSLGELCRLWSNEGHDVFVATTNTEGRGILSVNTNINHNLEGYKIRYFKRNYCESVSWQLLINLPKLIMKTDVVYLNMVYSFPSIPTLLISKIAGKPLIWVPHGGIQCWKYSRRKVEKRIWEWLCKLILPQKSRFHFTSEIEQTESLERFGKFPSFVVQNGVKLPKIPEARNHFQRANELSLRLTFIGRLHPIKGLESLLGAMQILKNENIFLNIYGSGDERYESALKSLARNLGISNTVAFRGFLSDTNKAKAFSETDVLVAPSLTESFGNVIGEALAYGKPVITTRHSPWKNIEDKLCGLCVENNPMEFANAIRNIKTRDLQKMGNHGRRWIEKDFSWQDRAEQLINRFEELTEN